MIPENKIQEMEHNLTLVNFEEKSKDELIAILIDLYQEYFNLLRRTVTAEEYGQALFLENKKFRQELKLPNFNMEKELN